MDEHCLDDCEDCDVYDTYILTHLATRLSLSRVLLISSLTRRYLHAGGLHIAFCPTASGSQHLVAYQRTIGSITKYPSWRTSSAMRSVESRDHQPRAHTRPSSH